MVWGQSTLMGNFGVENGMGPVDIDRQFSSENGIGQVDIEGHSWC